MQAAGNYEPISFNRVGDAGRIGRDRAQVTKGFPSLRLAAGRLIEFAHDANRCPYRKLKSERSDDEVRLAVGVRVDRARLWRVLVQRPVRSDLVVVAGIRLEGLAQVRFTHDHNMVEALPPDRSDKPFDMAILPRRAGCATADRSAVELALQIFADAVDPRRGPVQVYLQGRGLGRLPDDVIDVRYHPRCPRGTDRLPAMIALMRDAVSNEPTGVHRTFLRSDGSGKADVSPAKMMLGRAAGSVVKLTPDEDVLAGLGLSEGLEDGIAILNMGWRPVWACMSAVGMSHFPVLRGIEALSLFRDADRAGLSAADSCAVRWRRAGLSAVVVDPRNGKDFAAMAEALCHG